MAIFDNFPYTNFHELNLDWVLKALKDLDVKVDEVATLKTIKYADPIAWNITSQYEANTVVVNNQTGDAYISTKAVPSGVLITNTNYWTIIFNYSQDIQKLERQIAAVNEGASTSATAARSVGTLVWLSDKLYKITSAMNAGDTYVVNSNCIAITIEELLNTLKTSIDANTLAISNEETARTTADATLLSNINTVGNKVLPSGGTARQILSKIDAVNYNAHWIDTPFITAEQFGAVGDGLTDDTTAVTNAINTGYNEHKTVLLRNNKFTNIIIKGFVIASGTLTGNININLRETTFIFDKINGNLNLESTNETLSAITIRGNTITNLTGEGLTLTSSDNNGVQYVDVDVREIKAKKCIVFHTVSNSWIQQNYFRNIVLTGPTDGSGVGISQKGSTTNVGLQGNNFINIASETNNKWFTISNFIDAVFDNCRFIPSESISGTATGDLNNCSKTRFIGSVWHESLNIDSNSSVLIEGYILDHDGLWIANKIEYNNNSIVFAETSKYPQFIKKLSELVSGNTYDINGCKPIIIDADTTNYYYINFAIPPAIITANQYLTLYISGTTGNIDIAINGTIKKTLEASTYTYSNPVVFKIA